jgi:CPA2 family monovalent cation:H+ antiporter-2
MEHDGILVELLVVYAVAALVVFTFHRLRAPSLVGLLLAGLVVGPYGLGLVSDIEIVKDLAEIGVVILLFTVGLELSLSRLWSYARTMLVVGVPQVVGSGLVTMLVTYAWMEGWKPALFVGMLVAMSSTAVVMKILIDRGESDAPFGRVAVSVLLLQDLLVTACMISLPLLSDSHHVQGNIWQELGISFSVVIGVLVAIRFAIPPLMFQILKTRNRELFIMAILLVCLGTAAITASVGLSLALGAFLAGLALSDSEYAHQTMAEVLPFRDTLSSLFFVSVGMLLDVGFVMNNLFLVAGIVIGVLILKSAVVMLPLWIERNPLRTVVLSGISLAQIGEFSFVLANRGVEEYGIIGQTAYQAFLAAAVVTMSLSPFLIALGPRIVEYIAKLLPNQKAYDDVPTDKIDHCYDHVIIAGYGLNGHNVARVLRDLDLPYVIVEMNPITVRSEKDKGEPIVLGDCSRAPLLEHLGVKEARAMVIVISDPAVTRRTVRVARQVNPHLHIIVRTRYVSEVDELRQLGASEIIPEEFETSVEIFARVLQRFLIPRNLILDLVQRIRHDHYEVLRDGEQGANKMELPVGMLQEVTTITCLIRDTSPAVGKSLKELDFRGQTGATIIAIRRQGQLTPNPPADFQLEEKDIVILVGSGGQLDQAVLALDPRVYED